MAAMRMVMLGEGSGEQMVGAGEENNEEERFWNITGISIAIALGIVVSGQVLTTIVYIYKSGKVEEISKLTKIMMVLVGITGLILESAWIGDLFGMSEYVQKVI